MQYALTALRSTAMLNSSNACGNYQYSQTGLDRVAGLYVKGPGVLYASAGNNINLAAANIAGNAAVQIHADNNVNIQTLKSSRSDNFNAGNAENHLLTSQSSDLGSQVSAGSNLTISAGNTLSAKAAALSAQDTFTLAAAGNIVLDAGQTQSSYDSAQTSTSSGWFSSTTTNTQTNASAATAQASTLSGKSVSVIADQNLVSVGTVFKGAESVYVEGKDTTALSAAASAASIGTRLLSNQKITIGVGNKTELQGTEIESPQIAFIQNDPTKKGELILGASKDTTQTSHTEKSETAGLWQEQKGHGQTTQTLNQTLLKGNVRLDAALKITAQIPDTQGGQALKSQINALVNQSTGPGLDYLSALSQRTDIRWDQVALAHEQWSYSQAGLTPAGAALLSIVVAVYTGGMGVELLGGTSATAATATTAATSATLMGSTALGAAANAGFASLAAQASVAMVNNGGDIGKTLEQLGSEQSVKNILIAMATAGVGKAVAGQGGSAFAAQTLTGCVTGTMSGSGCEKAATTAAVLSSASEAYQSWVGYEANAGPGDNRNGFEQSTQTYKPDDFGKQIPADQGMNVIGFNKPGALGSQGGTFSRALNQVPTINATAGLHDYIFNANLLEHTTFNNIWTMPAAAVVAVPAALNNPNISWMTQVKQPDSVKAPVVPSVIRIDTNTAPTSTKKTGGTQ